MQTCSCSLAFYHLPAGFPPRPGSLNRRPPVVTAASKRDSYGWENGGGSLVDKNMIELRKRIHEMSMAERNYEPPVHWKEWEKQYYTHYDSDICEAVRILQTILMKTRPSVAIGVVALVVLSVPTSMIFISFHLVQAFSYFLHGIHLL